MTFLGLNSEIREASPIQNLSESGLRNDLTFLGKALTKDEIPNADDLKFLFKKWSLNTLENKHCVEALRQAALLLEKDPEKIIILESDSNRLILTSPSGNTVWEMVGGAFQKYSKNIACQPMRFNQPKDDRDNWGKVTFNPAVNRPEEATPGFVADHSKPVQRLNFTYHRSQMENDLSLDFSIRAFFNS